MKLSNKRVLILFVAGFVCMFLVRKKGVKDEREK